MAFVGAKLALVAGDRILTYLRDDVGHIPWPNMWDLPGGGREGAETPAACVLRELREEFGLNLPESRLLWRREMPSMIDPDKPAWFFAGRLAEDEVAAIRFGDEGQFWRMMPVQAFLTHPEAVPALQVRTRMALDDLGWLRRGASP